MTGDWKNKLVCCMNPPYKKKENLYHESFLTQFQWVSRLTNTVRK